MHLAISFLSLVCYISYARKLPRPKIEAIWFVKNDGQKTRFGLTDNLIAQCKTAGIKVFMVTGDHPSTAAAIARQIGLIGPVDQVSKIE